MPHIYEPILDSYQAKTGWQVKSFNFKLNYFSRLQKKEYASQKNQASPGHQLADKASSEWHTPVHLRDDFFGDHLG